MPSQLPTLSTQTRISAAFIADNSSNDILICSSADGQSWNPNAPVSAQSSSHAPSLCTFKDFIWIAFIADNSSNDLLTCSSPDGLSWSANSQVGSESSSQTPSLCVFQGRLWIAFIADNSSNDILICSSDGMYVPDLGGPRWSANSRVGTEFSSRAPSLCVFQGKLWIAFIADNSSNDILVCSSDDGLKWSGNSRVGVQSSSQAPSLCVFQDKLWIAFIADNSSNDILICSSDDGLIWSGNTQTGQSSAVAPSLTATPEEMYIGFLANNSMDQILICASPNGTTWLPNRLIGQSSSTFPAFFAQQTQTGTLRPKYQVVTIVYAPPGSAAATASSVEYTQASFAGTTNSISQAVKTAFTVTLGLGEDIFDAGFNTSRTATNASTIDILKSKTQVLSVSGPTQDGINHDYDQFWLLLNPLYTITSDNWSEVIWSMGVDGASMSLIYIYAAQLKDPSTLPPGVKAALDAAGVTTGDFQQILSLNPFAAGGTSIDPQRYLPVGPALPYQPPLRSGDPVPVIKYTEENKISTSQTKSTQVQYEIGVTLTAGLEDIFSLKTKTSMEWTNTNTAGINAGVMQSASLALGGPSFGYSGPVEVAVYWDTVFSTFMFAFAE